MITQPKLWQSVDLELHRRATRSYRQSLALFDALYAQARALGVLPNRRHPLAGLDVDIRYAAALQRLPGA